MECCGVSLEVGVRRVLLGSGVDGVRTYRGREADDGTTARESKSFHAGPWTDATKAIGHDEKLETPQP